MNTKPSLTRIGSFVSKGSVNYSTSLSSEEALETRSDAVPMHLNQALRHLRKRDFQKAEEEFATAIHVTAGYGDVRGMMTLHKHIAKMWMKVYSIRRALNHLKQQKYFADLLQLPLEKMKAYRGIGTCYQLVRKYDAALSYFKRLLELAWYYNNIEMELLAYDSIGKQYYYMGWMDKAEYYNYRVWNGMTENRDSGARLLSRHLFETRRKKRQYALSELSEDAIRASLRSDSRLSSEISEGELPSPMSNSSGPKSFSLLPHSFESPKSTRLPAIKQSSRTLVTDRPSLKYSKSSRMGLRPYILISHLSLNRSLKNYQCLKDARKIKVRRRKPSDKSLT